jgi:hypothetical protein
MLLNRNPAPDCRTRKASMVPLSAEGSAAEQVRRFSPLAALVVLTLLSLGTWLAIWAAVTSLLPG